MQKSFPFPQAVLGSRPEGVSKLQDMKSRAQSLCEHQDLEESRRREVQQTVREVKEEWRRVLQEAEEALHTAERQNVLEGLFGAFETQKKSTQSWIKEKQKHLKYLGNQKKTEERLHTAQVDLWSSK